MSVSVETAIPAVMPILPAVHSLLIVLSLLGVAGLAAMWSLTRPSSWKVLARFLWQQRLSLLVLVGGAVLTTMLIGWLRQAWRTPPLDQVTSEGVWPHRGGLARTACTDRNRSPRSGGVVWTGGRGDTFYSSPAVVGHEVYAVGLRGDRGRLYCWDLSDGRLRWSVTPSGYRATFSSPVVSGRSLVCGEGLHHTPAARVVCIDLSPGQEGDVLWTFTTGSHVECTPVIEGDKVFVAAGDDGIYCLRLSAELGDEDRVVWHRPGSLYPDAETSLAVHDGCVFVGLGTGGHALCQLDAETGEELDRWETPFPVFSPPSIVDDCLYVGMGYGNYATHGDNPGGQVCCLHLPSGRMAWSYSTPATVLGSLAVDRGEVIAGCADGRVHVLDTQGQLINQWNSRAPIVAAPSVSDDTIYVVNTDGILYGLDRQSLRPVWEVRLGAPSSGYVSSPVTAEGHVFVGTPSDGFVCAGSTPLSDDRSTPHDVAEELPDRADVLWEYIGTPDEALTALPVITSTELILAVRSPHSGGIICLNNDEDRPPELRWRYSSALLGTDQPPLVIGDRVIFLDGRTGESGRRLCAIDRLEGEMLWQRPVNVKSIGMLSGDELGIFIADPPGHLTCISLGGVEQWSAPVGEVKRAVMRSGWMLICTADDPCRLMALDAGTGRSLWSVPLNAAASLTLKGHQCEVLCDLRDPAGGNPPGELQVRSLVDGSLSGATPLARGQLLRRLHPAGVICEGHRLLHWRSDDDDELTVWADLESLGEITTDPVAVDARVYVGVEGHGLICLGVTATE